MAARRRQLGLVHQELEAAEGNVDEDLVAVLDQPDLSSFARRG
jgi:hypothetical protein